MSRAELKQLAKKQIKGNIPILFVFSIIANLSSTTGNIFANNFKFNKMTSLDAIRAMIPAMIGFGLLLWLLVFVVFSPLKISLDYTYLKVADEEKPQFNMLGYGFRNCWTQSALLGFFSNVFIFLWSLLFVIPGIIKSYSYRMSSYIMAENPEISALDAITKSKQMMKGHKFELFVLDLSFILWYLLVAITLGIASIYVMPYTTATRANFYLKLKEEQAE